jgi:hypothetical protein
LINQVLRRMRLHGSADASTSITEHDLHHWQGVFGAG